MLFFVFNRLFLIALGPGDPLKRCALTGAFEFYAKRFEMKVFLQFELGSVIRFGQFGFDSSSAGFGSVETELMLAPTRQAPTIVGLARTCQNQRFVCLKIGAWDGQNQTIAESMWFFDVPPSNWTKSV